MSKARYWKGTDSLIFSNVEVEKEKYVRVTGIVSDIKLNISTSRPAWFVFTSAEIARQVKVTCLQGTRAGRQLRDLTRPNTAALIMIQGVKERNPLMRIGRYGFSTLGAGNINGQYQNDAFNMVDVSL